MNLSSMFEDQSLVNLEWLGKPETYKPQDKDIDKKDDLAIEWGSGPTIHDDPDPKTINNEMNPHQTQGDVETLLHCAYVLMHQGIMGKYLIRQLQVHFTPEIIDAATPQLKELLKNEGIVGCAVIDLTRAKNGMGEFIKAASKSPYKRHINYVLMTPSQMNNTNLVEKRVSFNTSMKTGSIDGFFDGAERSKSYEYYYKPLGLKVIALSKTPIQNSPFDITNEEEATPRREDLDSEWYDKTLIELAALGDLEECEIATIKASNLSRLKKLRSAFRKAYCRHMMRVNACASQKAVDRSSDYKMEASIMDAEVSKSIVRTDIKNIAMDVAQPEVDIGSDNDMDELEYGDSMMSAFDVDKKSCGDIEVDAGQFLEKEFVGSELIELDDKKSAKEKVDVDMSGGFSF